MGQEIATTLTLGRKKLTGTALLESGEVIFRGEARHVFRAKGMSRWWEGAGLGEGRARPSSAAPEHAAYLHVSAGLGTSPFAPVRFACRPEATLLTLVPRG